MKYTMSIFSNQNPGGCNIFMVFVTIALYFVITCTSFWDSTVMVSVDIYTSFVQVYHQLMTKHRWRLRRWDKTFLIAVHTGRSVCHPARDRQPQAQLSHQFSIALKPKPQTGFGTRIFQPPRVRCAPNFWIRTAKKSVPILWGGNGE